ncbi:hypothetical protein EK21DRAFT_113953 [Setomelanomma holmii]|uniref:Uncharacterized protein n=1 Tax=Setomelanomma holmii TaxID=210430 RepID=A0A9P4H511_9PLEO|nr:hypothetical protein EK21DRAFT_113953 [Setomelanomma holmii]
MHLALQLQLHHYIRHVLAQDVVAPPDAAAKRSEDATRLLMATLHYDNFAKDASLPQLDLIPTSLSIELIKLFLDRGADPNYLIEGALMTHGNITGDYSIWGVHYREQNQSSETWAAISTLLLEHGADRRW